MSFDPFNPFTQPPRRPQNGAQMGARNAGQKPGNNKGTKAEAKAKRSKVLRFMFNPEFGSSFEGFKEAHGLFLRLVANVFLQAGLIDATYPGLSDPQQLKLKTLLETAYRDLQYTREGMPRVLLFYAFVGSMAAVVISLLIFLAHIAQGGTAPAPTAAHPPAAKP